MQMEPFKSLFTRTMAPDVYICDRSIDGLSELAQAYGFQYLYLDGRKIKTSADFFREAKHVMKFPDYFGQNWNSVLDCMRDLDYWWKPSQGCFLLYNYFEHFANKDSASFHTSIEVMKAAVESWQDTETSMYVLLAGDISIVPNLQRLT